MNNLLDALSINSLGQKVLYPLLELNKEIESISLNRHRIRSCFKITIAILLSLALIEYTLNNYKLMEIIKNIIEVCNFSKETQPFLSIGSCIILCCNIGTFIGNIAVKFFCQIRYGESEFYLTPRRLSILEKKLQEQINSEISKDNIKDVIDFCVKNFYKENSQELGGKKEDWRKTIESLIYEGDLEHFIDQQRALLLKKQQLETKSLEIISQNYQKLYYQESPKNYGSINDFKNNIAPCSTSILRQSNSAPIELTKVIESGFSPLIINSGSIETKTKQTHPLVIDEKFEEYLREHSKDYTTSINELITHHLKELTSQAEHTEKMLFRENPITKFCCLNCSSNSDNIVLLYDAKKVSETTKPTLYYNLSSISESSNTSTTPRNRGKNKAHVT